MPRTVERTRSLIPVEVWEVPYYDKAIKFRRPLLLQPVWLKDDPAEPDIAPVNEVEYMGVDEEELGISAFGATREELLSCIFSDVCFAWEHFVEESDSRLDTEGHRIKNNYLSIAEVVDE
ncbi:MAG: hypothetical protein ACRC10_00015 [Thermoguttaceae bacterium]